MAALAAPDCQHGKFDQAFLPVAFDELIDRQEALMPAFVAARDPDPTILDCAQASKARGAGDGIHDQNITSTKRMSSPSPSFRFAPPCA
jgi:hypothetical protein